MSLQGPSLSHPQATKAQDHPIVIQSTIASIQHLGLSWSLVRSPAKLSVENASQKAPGLSDLSKDSLLHSKRADSPGTPLIATTNSAGLQRSSGPGKAQAAVAFGELMSYYTEAREAALQICSTCNCSRRSRFCLRKLLLVFSNLSILWLSLRGEESMSSSWSTWYSTS